MDTTGEGQEFSREIRQGCDFWWPSHSVCYIDHRSEVRGQGIMTPPGCADVTSSLAPAGVQGKTEAIAPRRRLPYPRTPGTKHPPDRAERPGGGSAWTDAA